MLEHLLLYNIRHLDLQSFFKSSHQPTCQTISNHFTQQALTMAGPPATGAVVPVVGGRKPVDPEVRPAADLHQEEDGRPDL